MYASPREQERHDTWQRLRALAHTITIPWLMMGDFNEIADPGEKKGGAPSDLRRCMNFANWINACQLLDVTTVGTRFTWRGPLWEGRERVFKRLDRVLCNVGWRLRFQEGFGKVLPRVHSDHHPIMIMLNGEPHSPTNRPFRFEVAWLSYDTFPSFLQEKWNKDVVLPTSLQYLTPNLHEWNKETFGNIFHRKKELLARLNGIQNSPTYGRSRFLDFLEKELQDQLALTLHQENVYGSRSLAVNR